MVRRLPLVVIGCLALAAPAIAIAATTTTPATGSEPAKVKSVFKADRASSLPVGLTPDDVARPFAYPDQPIVLSWSPVPGAKSYKVEVASNPGFTDIKWSTETDQTQAAPELLFPDGAYWWRVVATDEAGVRGIVSQPARFAKVWNAKITGNKVAATPGGPAVSQVDLQPYFTWNALPGATGYDVDVAPADQFASPIFKSVRLPAPFVAVGESGVLPDDVYQWRTRGRDPKGNPGPWSAPGQFVKAWVRGTPVAPADNSATSDLRFEWQPVPGAEAYEIQVTDLQHNYVGTNLKVNGTTPNTAYVPTLEEHTSTSLSYGPLWWRVRPVVNGIPGGWSVSTKVTYQAPSSPVSGIVLNPTADSDTALMPTLSWSPVTGASIYRVDIATDAAFNNVVQSEITPSTSWVPRNVLPDNQVGTGYHWRIIWGTGFNEESPNWQVDEQVVPTGTFRKQTRIVLGLAHDAQVNDSPLLSWGSVPGAAVYELQVSKDPQFDASAGGAAVTTVKTWGTGEVIGTHTSNAPRLADGTWHWRVRPIADGQGQSWSPARMFTLTSPRPTVTQPEDGATAVGAPLMAWTPVPHACAYDVQIGTEPALGDSVPTVQTFQTAIVLSDKQIPEAGRYYWRVRADRCDGIKGPWSPTRALSSVKPPDFGMNKVPAQVTYGGKTTFVGTLSYGGSAVRRPVLILERRFTGQRKFRYAGRIRGDARGRFAFRIKNRRTAAYRLRWRATASHPEGIAAFAMRVVPRVNFRVNKRKVARRTRLIIRGTVFPKRRALIQTRISGRWRTIRTVRPKRARFAIGMRANLVPGNHRIRVLVPGDKRLSQGRSKARKLFVYDRFVIRARR